MPYSWIFIGFILAEILSVILMVSWLGALGTILLMVLFFLLGIYMLRYIGMSAFLLSLDIFRSRQSGLSLYQLLWPMRYGIAALCFLLPGFFSDFIGLILLLPFKGKSIMNHQTSTTDSNVIDGEFSEISPDETPSEPSHNTRHMK